MRAESFICRICGKRTLIAGFEDWDVPELCTECELEQMPTMLPEELEAHIKKLKKERGDKDDS